MTEVIGTTTDDRHDLATVSPDGLVEGGISDEELTALALAALEVDDPQAAPDASLFRGSGLPRAYLPGAMPGPHSPWLSVVAVLLVLAFLAITAFGFCITYGQLSFA